MPKALRGLLKRLLPGSLIDHYRLMESLPSRVGALERKVQILAQAYGRERYAACIPAEDHMPEANRHELCVHSQNGEDGILLFIFSKIGTTNRQFVEFGIGDGSECNTANLSLNFGWRGLLMDCEARCAARARAYYTRMLGERAAEVTILQSNVTVANINETLATHGREGEIDLLSIDIDGNDYWIWKAVAAVTPRVVAIEYNAALGYERAVTVEYDADFDRWSKHPSGLYWGASLPALTNLAREKGYRLVACDTHGVNAFFVRGDACEGELREVSPREAYFPLQDHRLGLITPESFSAVQDMPFVEV